MKILIIAMLWIAGMFVDILWCVTDKSKMKIFMNSIHDIPELCALSDSIIMAMLIVVLVILSVIWPMEIVYYPYTFIKKRSK